MQFILTCENGKQIDMSSYILQQMNGEITREDVEERINFYQSTNKYDLRLLNCVCTNHCNSNQLQIFKN